MTNKTLGEKLLSKGDLTYRRNNKTHQSSLKLNFFMEWDSNSNIFDYSCSEEGILLASSQINNYKSPIHFAFKIMAFHREIDSRFELLEMCEEYVNININVSKAHKKIQEKSLTWWEQYNNFDFELY